MSTKDRLGKYYGRRQEYVEKLALWLIRHGPPPDVFTGRPECELSSRERFIVTCAGYRPSTLSAFADLTVQWEFVVQAHAELGLEKPNGVLLDALEYLRVDTAGIRSRQDAIEAFEKCGCGITGDSLIQLQGKYNLSTRFIFEELKCEQVVVEVTEKLQEKLKR